jgi:3-oxoadipate enol-lactonase
LGYVPFAYAELTLALMQLDLYAETFSRNRCPGLVMASARDFIWPPEVGQRLASRIPGAEFVVLPDAVHLPNLNRPDEIVAQVENFLHR